MHFVTDGRTLRALAKKYGFEYDREYKYITKYNDRETERLLRKEGYKFKYIDGCFYPYLCKVEVM